MRDDEYIKPALCKSCGTSLAIKDLYAHGIIFYGFTFFEETVKFKIDEWLSVWAKKKKEHNIESEGDEYSFGIYQIGHPDVRVYCISIWRCEQWSDGEAPEHFDLKHLVPPDKEDIDELKTFCSLMGISYEEPTWHISPVFTAEPDHGWDI